MLHNLAVAWDARGADAWPKKIPDLYLGEPVVVVARLTNRDGNVVLKGRRGADDFTLDLPLRGGAKESGVARLWARRQVDSLMASLHEGVPMEDVEQSVARLGLRHHIVTRFTSLVAVDVTPTAPVDAELETRPVPTLLPKGSSLRHFFSGADSEAAARARANAPAKPPPPVRSAAAPIVGQPVVFISQGRLPQGATPAALLLWLGAACMGCGAALWRFRSRA